MWDSSFGYWSCCFGKHSHFTNFRAIHGHLTFYGWIYSFSDFWFINDDRRDLGLYLYIGFKQQMPFNCIILGIFDIYPVTFIFDFFLFCFSFSYFLLLQYLWLLFLEFSATLLQQISTTISKTIFKPILYIFTEQIIMFGLWMRKLTVFNSPCAN